VPAVLGLLGSFALSSYLRRTDRQAGKAKGDLLITLVLFAVASVLSGFANSSGLVSGTTVDGIARRPVYLISQSILALESPVERSGVNMGIAQNLGSSILVGS